MFGAGARLSAILVAMGGCGASAGDDGQGGPDGPGGGDARAIDAASPDARPCVEGDTHMVDPMTGTCFAAFTQQRVTWLDARAECNAIGADLAIIRSAADNQMLTMLLGAHEAFVGGTDLALEGTFRWVDDSLLTYTNWRDNPDPNPDEPTNGGGNYQEDCIVLQGQLAGVWDDRPCDSSELMPPAGTYYAVCAR